MNAPAEIVVAAQWQVAGQAVDDVLDLVAELRTHALAEPGCLGFEVFQSPAEPGILLLLERYRDEEAIETHRQSEHYRSLVVGRILPMLAQRKVELLQAFGPG